MVVTGRKVGRWLALVIVLGLAQPGSARAELSVPPALPALDDDLAAYRVQRPGLVLIDPTVRRAFLSGLAPATREHWCGEAIEGWPRHGVARHVRADIQVGDTLAWTMMIAGARILAFTDRHAAAAIVTNLRRWAHGDALSRIDEPKDLNSFYNLDRTLLPVIQAYALVRETPSITAEDRIAIDAWLGRVMERRLALREFDPGKRTTWNNHRYLFDATTMAFGTLFGDHALFRDGIERFLIALEQLTSSGGLPFELERGPLALHYQRHAAASLIAIAEMAAVQGYDLYGAESTKGRRLADAVTFLADALRNPSRLDRALERLDLPPAPVQDLDFLVRRGHERHYMAWFETYLLRFPDAPETVNLKPFVFTQGEATRPLIDDYSGGSMTCFFARTPTKDNSAR
ncbi:MAG: alginate lyase family protein [Geminicoccaceae bacterium]